MVPRRPPKPIPARSIRDVPAKPLSFNGRTPVLYSGSRGSIPRGGSI